MTRRERGAAEDEPAKAPGLQVEQKGAQTEGERQNLHGVLPHRHGLEREGGRKRPDESSEPGP